MHESASGIRGPHWTRRFFPIWIGQAFSIIGSQVAAFAVVWWLTQQTGSAKVLAGLTIAQLLPQIFLAPFAGALVDRWNRRLVMMAADGLSALLAAVLAVLFLSGNIQVWHIFTITFIRSLLGAFHFAAFQASTSLMVPEDQLSRVAGMNQTLWGALNIIAPPLGALLLGVLSFPAIMGIDVVTALLAVAPMLFVRIPQPVRQTAATTVTSVTRDVKDGFVYLWHWPGARFVLFGSALINALVWPAMSLMPLLVTKHFSGGALQLGWMNSAFSIGMVAGGLTLSAWGGFKRKSATVALGLTGGAVGMLMAGAAPAALFWLAFGGLLLFGFTNPLVNGPLVAIVQSAVPADMQGRVFTVIGSFASLASPVGMALAGPLADQWGVQFWFIIAAFCQLALALVVIRTPALANFESGKAKATGGAVVVAPVPCEPGQSA
jgi:DHA3 family macrolide efflux protein-like MFS transporter